jgi:putative transcriptional regulator
MSDTSSSLAGQLLLAMPGIGDPRFAQAAIAMWVHTEDGAMGVGIGRTVPRLGLHALLKQLDIAPGVAPDAAICLGGPVEPQRGFVLHTPDWTGEDTLAIGDALALTTTLDILRAIAAGEGPDRWLIALGYAGWGEGQLDRELGQHGWFHVGITDELLFETPVADRWPRAFASAGVDVRLLAPTAGHA